MIELVYETYEFMTSLLKFVMLMLLLVILLVFALDLARLLSRECLRAP